MPTRAHFNTHTHTPLFREWRAKLEQAAPGLVDPLLSVGFIPRVDAVLAFDKRRLLHRVALRLGTGAAVSVDDARRFIAAVGGDEAALASTSAALPLADFVDVCDRATADVRRAPLFFAVQQHCGVVALTPDVEDALVDMYTTLCADRGSVAFTPDDMQSVSDHLGVGVSTHDAMAFLSGVAGAPATKDPRVIVRGVDVTLEEFLNFAGDLLFGVPDDAVLKHVRVWHMMRTL